MATSPNRRQRVIEFSTPKVADLVVVEVKDSSKNTKKADKTTGVKSDGSINNYGDAHPDTENFPNFKLALIKNADDQQGQFQYWYYIKDRAEQDKYNWEFQAAGASNPLYDTVVRTYILPRYGSGTNGALGDSQTGGVDVFDEALPAINSAMPTTIHDPFGHGLGPTAAGTIFDSTDSNYVLFEKKQVRSGDDTLDSLYVVEQRIYVKKIPIRRTDVDTEFNIPLRSKETLWYKSEVPKKTFIFGATDTTFDVNDSKTTTQTFALGDDATSTNTGPEPDQTVPFFGTSLVVSGSEKFGILCEGRQLTDNWYAVAESEVLRTDTNGLVRSYTTYQNYSWPAVLERIEDENWTRRDGGTDTIVYPIYKRGAYSGPTKVKVEIYWTDTSTGFPVSASKDGGHTHVGTVTPMFPEPCVFQTPIATVNVPPTLHTQILVSATTGTNHPVYDYIGTRWLFLATNYTDWPDEIIIADSQRPFRGGYLREKITAYKPEAGT